MIVQLAGLPGTGKTTLAALLHQHLPGPVLVLDKDRVRAALFGAGHTRYERDQDDQCVELLHQSAAWWLHRHPEATVILDGRTCSRAYQVQQVRNLAHRAGQRLRLIECVCPLPEIAARLHRDHHTAAHPAANRTPTLARHLARTADPIPHPKLTLDTSTAPDRCAAAAAAWLLYSAHGDIPTSPPNSTREP